MNENKDRQTHKGDTNNERKEIAGLVNSAKYKND